MRCLLFFLGLTALATAGTFTISNDEFQKDGQPFHIFAGCLHYFRVHPSLWADRLARLKSMGLNAIQSYVAWNFHEEQQGMYDFNGWRNISAFLQAAQDANMLVLLRPGPYICAEWDFGGFPPWLLALQPPITIRTYETGYITQVDKWWNTLLPLVKPYLYENGGPVVMVQIENEYGSYGDVSTNPNDMQYMQHLVDLARSNLGPNIILYTTDGGDASYMKRGTIPGSAVFTTGDFGPGSNPMSSFNAQKQFNDPGMSPNMCSEYYTGWLTHWGESMANTSTSSVVNTLKSIIDDDGSFSLYMGHGGTNFGWFAGANGGGTSYQPHITSYDYDGPISEGGGHGYGPDGDKFVGIANLLKNYVSTPPPEPPAPAVAAYGSVVLGLRAGLFDSLSALTGTSQKVSRPASMETYGQSFGFILYSVIVPTATSSNTLSISGDYVRDRAQVFVNRNIQGTIYRTQAQSLSGISASANSLLELLVDAMGRINYGSGMFDAKGITSNAQVLWNGATLSSWNVTTLPLQPSQVAGLQYVAWKNQTSGPAFYRGTLTINGTPRDTYIAPQNWGKGVIWINGFNIGRYWESQGPQHTLYIPAALLQSGANDVIVLELEKSASDVTVVFRDTPDFHTGGQCYLDQAAGINDYTAMYPCNSAYDSNQVFVSNSDQTFSLKNNPKLCLQEGPTTDPSSGYPSIVVATCTGASNQKFTYNSSKQIVCAANSQCFDITTGSSAAGTRVETYPCHAQSNQEWTLDSAGHIVSSLNSFCVSVCAGSGA